MVESGLDERWNVNATMRTVSGVVLGLLLSACGSRTVSSSSHPTPNESGARVDAHDFLNCEARDLMYGTEISELDKPLLTAISADAAVTKYLESRGRSTDGLRVTWTIGSKGVQFVQELDGVPDMVIQAVANWRGRWGISGSTQCS